MADKVAMYVGGGLVIIGTVVIGLLDMFLGAGHPVDSDGAIIHEAIVPLEVRSYIILLGLLIWGAYAIYKVFAGKPTTPTPTPDATARGAD